MTSIKINKASVFEFKSIDLPGSKSESNRALIIQALAKENIEIKNLSNSEDTDIISDALKTSNTEIDCKQSGAALRFLTAYFACKSGEERVLTGSSRLKERPIKPLVDALKLLGAEIHYLENEGFAPIKINGKKLSCKEPIELETSLSSQFLSALLLISTEIEHGLKVEYDTELNSKPYVMMTIQMLEKSGIKVIQKNNLIHIPQQKHKKTNYQIESDWTAASYWYALVSMGYTSIELKGLKENSLQGDSMIYKWMNDWDVHTEFTEKGLIISHQKKSFVQKSYDFSQQPDLAQTLIVLAAAKQRNIEVRGIESLKHKETNRIAALQIELRKLFVELTEKSPGRYNLETIFLKVPDHTIVQTYHDHRMAMSFAILSLLCKTLEFDDANVVNKSYPHFWKHLKSLGFIVNID